MTALHPHTAAPAALGRPSPTLTLQQSLSSGGVRVFGFNRNLWLSGIPSIPTGKHTISARGSRPQGGEGDSGRADPQAPALTSRLPTCVSPSSKPSKEACPQEPSCQTLEIDPSVVLSDPWTSSRLNCDIILTYDLYYQTLTPNQESTHTSLWASLSPRFRD